MTDLDDITRILNAAVIPYQTHTESVSPLATVLTLSVAPPACRLPSITGYAGLFCEFHFDRDGHLTTIGVWE